MARSTEKLKKLLGILSSGLGIASAAVSGGAGPALAAAAQLLAKDRSSRRMKERLVVVLDVLAFCDTVRDAWEDHDLTPAEAADIGAMAATLYPRLLAAFGLKDNDVAEARRAALN